MASSSVRKIPGTSTVISTGTLFESEPTVEVGDFVYMTSSARLDKAQANDISTMPAIGIVTAKPASNVAEIQRFHILDELTGITPNTRYYVSESDPGEIQDTTPTTPGSIVQLVALGVGTTILNISIVPNLLIIRS